jgi:hypothetical protein
MHDRLGVDPQVVERGTASMRPDAELLTSHTADLGNKLCTLVCDEPVLHWSVRLRARAAVDHDRPAASLDEKPGGCVAL